MPADGQGRLGAPTVFALLGFILITSSVWALWSLAGAGLVAGLVLFVMALFAVWVRSRAAV